MDKELHHPVFNRERKSRMLIEYITLKPMLCELRHWLHQIHYGSQMKPPSFGICVRHTTLENEKKKKKRRRKNGKKAKNKRPISILHLERWKLHVCVCEWMFANFIFRLFGVVGIFVRIQFGIFHSLHIFVDNFFVSTCLFATDS